MPIFGHANNSLVNQYRPQQRNSFMQNYRQNQQMTGRKPTATIRPSPTLPTQNLPAQNPPSNTLPETSMPILTAQSPTTNPTPVNSVANQNTGISTGPSDPAILTNSASLNPQDSNPNLGIMHTIPPSPGQMSGVLTGPNTGLVMPKDDTGLNSNSLFPNRPLGVYSMNDESREAYLARVANQNAGGNNGQNDSNYAPGSGGYQGWLARNMSGIPNSAGWSK